MQFKAETFCTAPLCSGRIVPRVTIGRGTPFIPRERHNVKHSIAGYLRLPRPALAPALMPELHWLYSMQLTEQIPDDPPRMGETSTTTSNHPR